jgi:hypothetical protein
MLPPASMASIEPAAQDLMGRRWFVKLLLLLIAPPSITHPYTAHQVHTGQAAPALMALRWSADRIEIFAGRQPPNWGRRDTLWQMTRLSSIKTAGSRQHVHPLREPLNCAPRFDGNLVAAVAIS